MSQKAHEHIAMQTDRLLRLRFKTATFHRHSCRITTLFFSSSYRLRSDGYVYVVRDVHVPMITSILRSVHRR